MNFGVHPDVFDHEKLDVYRASIEFATWTHARSRSLSSLHRNARDQLIRASQSIPINIAEGNGRILFNDRRRFLAIALGSAFECGAALDILRGCGAIPESTANEGKQLLNRIASMLVRMSASATPGTTRQIRQVG